MTKLHGIGCLLLLLNVTWIMAHDDRSLNSMDRKLRNKMNLLREDLRNELLDSEEKIKTDVKRLLPGMMAAALSELLSEVQIDNFKSNLAQSEIKTLKQKIKQLEAGMLHSKRKLALSEGEQTRQRDVLQKIRSELMVVVSTNNVMHIKLTRTKSECGMDVSENSSSVTTPVTTSLTTPVTTSITTPVTTSVTTPVTTSLTTPVTTPVTTPAAAEGETFTHLLAVGSKSGQFYQFDLKQNYSRTNYPLKPFSLIDFVFDNATRSIIWSNFSGIYSRNIDNKKVISFITGMNNHGITLAVDNGILFYAAYYRYIYKMTLESTRSTRIASEEDLKAFDIELDRIDHRVFSSNQFRILQMDYDGNNRHVVIRGYHIFALAYDPTTKELYYGEGSIIKKVVPAFGRTYRPWSGEVVIGVPYILQDLIYYRGVLYAGDIAYGKIRAINVTTLSAEVIGSVPSQFGVNLCFIP